MNNLFNLLYDKIDIPLISYFIDYSNVAQYSVAYGFYNLSGTMFGIILIPLFTYFSNKKLKYDERLQLLKSSAAIILAMAVTISLIFIFFGKMIVIGFFGEKYYPAGEIVAYFSPAIIFTGLNGLTGIFLNALQMFNKTMTAFLTGISLNILIDIIALPVIGIKGAIVASTAAAVMVFGTELFFIVRYIKKQNENSIPRQL